MTDFFSFEANPAVHEISPGDKVFSSDNFFSRQVGRSLALCRYKFYDRTWIFQGVGMMADAFLSNHFKATSHFLIPLLRNQCIFTYWNHFVVHTDNMNDRNICFGQRGEVVHRVIFICFGLLLIFKTVHFQNRWVYLWPAFKIKNRCIGINGGYFFGI